MEHEKRFHDLLLIFSMNARVQLSPLHFEIYDDAFREVGLTYELAAQATKRLLQKSKNWQMPTPAQIIDEAMPKVQALDEANNVAGLIIRAIRDHGYSNPSDARKDIGALGWEAVDRHGGWHLLCCGDHDIGQLRAQLRDSVKSIIEVGRVRPIHEPPALPSPDADRIKTLALASGKEMP